jgi:hypothetical protein
MAVGIRHAEYATRLYQQKLALTSPTSGGRSVGVVRSRTKATEFIKFILLPCHLVDVRYIYGRLLFLSQGIRKAVS